jgi:hypothetical protein
MSQELEEQQRLASNLKEQLQSMEDEERMLTEKIRVLDAKLVVQELQDKVKVKSEGINQLRDRVKMLEEKLRSPQKAPVEEQPQIISPEEKAQRQFF